MNFRIQIFAVIGSLIIVFSVFQLIRKRKLMERYSLLWFASSLVLIVFSFWRDLLEKFAELLGVEYAPSVLIIVIIFCGFLLSLHFSVVISKLSEQNKVLAQELALLRARLEEMQKGPAVGEQPE